MQQGRHLKANHGLSRHQIRSRHLNERGLVAICFVLWKKNSQPIVFFSILEGANPYQDPINWLSCSKFTLNDLLKN